MGPHPSRRIHQYTYADYLAYEADSNVKHEFLDGEIYAMAGGTLTHAVVAMNIGALLSASLRDKPCVVAGSDLKVRVVETNLTTYPDITVICGHPELDPRSQHVALNPTLLAEVTSDSTEAWDRGEKLDHYKKIASLRDLLLVSHRGRNIDLVRRRSDGSWSHQSFGAGETLPLESVGVTLAVDEVYRNADVS